MGSGVGCWWLGMVRSCSSWWREIMRIRDGKESSGDGWFAECVTRRVGDGAATSLWRDFGAATSQLGICFC